MPTIADALAPAETPDISAQPDHERRRSFAIISHPDAGKTTLTENLLHASGAIRLAGQVRARGERRRTRSDWLEIEQKRGISVTSSVMTFEHRGLTFNLLDTPGHADFSEDTYRTLTAVDAAIMVIDAAKGIESQTLKLFEVCRLRDIPIITFVNKVDREGREPLELIDEVADTLALDVTPVTWPLGMGVDFRGCLDLTNGEAPPEGADDPVVAASIEALELARAALPAFDLTSYREGHLTPIFFGSALRRVGIGELLSALAAWAPAPRPQPASARTVDPGEDKVSGFVFKVQANMDPNHRDRVAFVRLASGRFRRGMKLHHVRLGRDIAVGNPMFFFAQERETADEAVAGDVIGIPNHGLLSVGDTLTEGEKLRFTGIPSFAPEILRRVRLEEAIKAKQLGKALGDLAEEGIAQVFRPAIGSDWIVGVVGPLQLDVLATRIAAEYGIAMRFETAGCETARWLASKDASQLEAFLATNRASAATDRDGAPVFLARNAWALERAMQDWPAIRFAATRERGY